MRLFGITENQPLEFLVCGQLKSKDKFLHMRRNFSDNVLIFVQEGTLFINSSNHNYEVSKNQFIFLKAGEDHFGYKESQGPLSYYWVHFTNTPELIKEASISSFDYIFPEYGTVNNCARFNMLFKQLMDFSLDKSFYNKQILNYSLSILLMELTQNYLNSINKNTEKQDPLVNDICNWIKYNFQKNFSLEELSLEFNLQGAYLSKIFKQNTGKSLIQYITEIRLSAAKDMLQTFTIKETAYSCGFEDEKYFMKVFKKHEGITPTQFKQAFSLRNVNQ